MARVVKDEEHRYATTFQVAEKFFQDEAKAAVGGVLPAPAAFKLYDTYGLALDEQEDMARELGISIDREGFAAEMEKQRTRARASWKGAEKAQVNPVYQALPQDRIRRPRDAGSAGEGDGGAATAKSRWIGRRSTPRPAARSAIRACWSRENGRNAGGRGIGLRAGSRQDGAQGEAAWVR